ncbi:EF-P-Lys34 lysylation protein [Gammaproteobacteria bacterium]|nr:EF-P-Lys34 lysylation protein [Gammaproteobacteria bacterium]
MNKSLISLDNLEKQNLINKNKRALLEPVVAQFQIRITPDMLNAIKNSQSAIEQNLVNYENNPVFKQFVPDIAENTILPEELIDPIGDNAYTPVAGIVHRYCDRVLLKLTAACAVYCRFCFRREMIGAKGEQLSTKQLELALDYIENHQEIWEVILTGGDPLIASQAQLTMLFTRLNKIAHVKNIRIHTRIPIVEPKRISAAMLSLFQTVFTHQKSLYIVIHANHAQEFTENAIKTLAQIADAGIPMLSQSVLLKNINDNLDDLSTLMRTFILHRIKPYYLHQMDLAKGTSHFKVDELYARDLIRALRANISGICIPVLIQEIPAGVGKVPIF